MNRIPVSFNEYQFWHYDECTNSSIEVSFGGMKYSGMPVNPQHSVSHSACTLSLSSEIKNTARELKKWPQVRNHKTLVCS